MGCFKEVFFFELLVRQHAILKLEEVAGLRVSELFWFVDFRPNSVQIALKDALDPRSVVSSSVEVSEHKKEFFAGFLIKKLQVHLKDHLKESIVGCTVPANVIGPHIDEQNISDCQCK